jgi:polyhydroxyalkanoate synthase
LHEDFLDLFLDNRMTQPNALTTLGTPVDLSKVDCDAYIVGGLTDHLTPWKGCYRTTQLLGGDTTFVLSSTGHIQTPVCPPGNPKSRYWTGGSPTADPDAWIAGATEHQSTWWEHWIEWLCVRSGGQREVAKTLGSTTYPPIAPAPGEYVLEPS